MFAFCIFVLGGVEAMRLTPGIKVTNGSELHLIPYTHSPLSGIIWGGGATVGIWALSRNRTGAYVTGTAMHWPWTLGVATLLVHLYK